jgi:hypothetical protein
MIILDYTWSIQNISNVPKYAHVSTRSVYDHVSHCLPPRYQIRDLIHLVVAYFEPNGFMVQVEVDMQRMLTQRTQDAFFLYDVLSRIDPVPSVFTVPSVLPRISTENQFQMESASCPRLFLQDPITGVDYYRTRTGHLGLFHELMTRAHSVQFQGQLSYTRPNLQQFKETQTYLILCSQIDILSWMNLCPCNRTRQWIPGHQTNRVLILDRDCEIPPEVSAFPWDNVILDHMSTSVRTTCISDPTDTSRVTGYLGETIPLLYHSILQHCRRVHYISPAKDMTYLRILECMMYLRTTYDNRLLLRPGEFSVNRHTIIRICENMFTLNHSS